MQLEKILYINLDTSVERNEAFINQMRMCEGAMPILLRQSAVNGRAFRDRDHIIRKASAEGFDVSDCWYELGSMACIYSYLTCLKYIRRI